MSAVTNIPSTEQTGELTRQLASLQQKQFSGRLEVKSAAGVVWQLYLCLGRLIWVNGGEHPHRSWRRHLTKYCPQANQLQLQLSLKDLEPSECNNYQFLTSCVQKKLVKPQQIAALVKNKVQELLFDILQQQSCQKLSYAIESAKTSATLASMSKVPLALIDPKQAIEQTQISWSEWIKEGLAFWSPNLAPSITNPKSLAKLVLPKTYQNLVKLLDGKKTLRDLAFLLDEDVLKLTSFLSSYVHQGLLELVVVKDIVKPTNSVQANSNSRQQQLKSDRHRPLIVSIDDLPEIGKLMGQIFKKAGYRFISIQDGLQAVSQLISCQPDLIFLDVDMPIVNGYEICAQIRRIPDLKDIPVVVLTGHDSMLERLRAKMAGTSDFLAKPIDAFNILDTVMKFVPSVSERENN